MGKITRKEQEELIKGSVFEEEYNARRKERNEIAQQLMQPMTTKDEKSYVVESVNGGYGELWTFENACEIAHEDSIERSCIMMVRHQTEYIPTRIYHSGRVYELVEEARG